MKITSYSYKDKITLLRKNKKFQRNFEEIDKNLKADSDNPELKTQTAISAEDIEKTLEKSSISHKNSIY